MQQDLPAENSAVRAGSKKVGLRCDFCGEQVVSVRRVALDQDYDRLLTPHRERYACPSCSERKERARRGLDR
ncbi:MAG: hypothetical protein NTZ61_18915 [Proteobacteria bacterium]|nr:hypothetical protein [Pseudomonadota bacterium]